MVIYRPAPPRSPVWPFMAGFVLGAAFMASPAVGLALSGLFAALILTRLFRSAS